MRPNRHQLARIVTSSRALLGLGCGGLLTLTPLNRAVAQDPGSSPANAPVTDTSATPASGTDTTNANNPAAAPVEALPPGTNSADTSHAVVPGFSQNPANPTPTTIPLFPSQLGNPVSPYNSSSTNPQSPQLTQPGLYVTGTTDLAQAAKGNALTQAFSQPGVAEVSGEDAGMNYEHPPIERLKLGPFDLKAAVVANAVADDNVRNNGTTGSGKKSDIEFGVTPALLLVYGTHDGQKGFASLVYAPTINQYYHESNQNGIDQNVAVNAIYPLQRLTFNATQTFTQTTGTNQDSNTRTTQESILSGFGIGYEVDDKISLASQLAYTKSTFSNPGDNGGNGGGAGGAGAGGQGDTTLSINNSASYRVSEKLTVGPSVNFGWDRPENSQKSNYEQGLANINFAPTEKIGIYAQGGVELRQYDNGGGDKANPVFAVGIGYAPFDSTNINLDATQASHASTAALGDPTAGQTILNTSVGASITQRIAQRVFVAFAFNYNHEDDQGQNGGGGGGGGGGALTGTEDNFTYRPSVTYAPTAWSNIAVYYQYLSNESTIQGEAYNDNQVGLSVSAQF